MVHISRITRGSPRHREESNDSGIMRDSLIRGMWFITAIFAVVTVFFIIAFLLGDSIPIFESEGVISFLTGEIWNPTGYPPSYGTFPLIVGTILVTIGAMGVASLK